MSNTPAPRFRAAKTAATLVAIATLLSAGAATAATPSVADVQELIEQGQYGPAQEGARVLLVSYEDQYGKDAVETTAVLDLLLEALWRGGKATQPETQAIGERSLAIKLAALGPADAGVGKTKHHLAIVAYYGGEYARARQLWEEAIEIRATALGEAHPDVAESVNALANLLLRTGELLEARVQYERALAIRREVFGERDKRVGQTLNNLSALLKEMGDYAEALPLAEWSLRIKEEQYGARHFSVTSTLINLGDLSDQLGDGARARELWSRATSILEETVGPDHRDVGACLNNLAEQDRRTGRYEAALPAFERALGIWEKAYGTDHPRVGIVLNNLAATHQALGELEVALELQERAVALREAGLGPDHPRLAISLQALADLLVAMGAEERAGELYARALAIRRERLGPEHPAVAESQLGLAAVRARAGATREAFALAVEAEGIARAHLRLTGRALSEQQALRYATTFDSGLDLALTLAIDGAVGVDVHPLLDALVRSRAVVLDEMAARVRSVARSADPEIRRLAEELARARTRLANLTVRGVGDTDPVVYRRLLDETRGEKERLERALGNASAEFARQQERGRRGAEDVLRAVPPDAALVSFVQYRYVDAKRRRTTADKPARPPQSPVLRYAAIVARRNRPPAVVALANVDAIDALVVGWKREAAAGILEARRSPAQAEAAYRRVADELRRRIWQPLAPAIGGIQRVFVVPDGALNLVSFAALPTAKGRYLIDSGPLLHYLSAERDLATELGQRTGRGLLTIGGADYDDVASFATIAGRTNAAGGGTPTPSTRAATRTVPCADFEALSFARLPGAEREGAAIAAVWTANRGEGSDPADGVTLLEGGAATERAFKQRAEGRRILHIATHGFFLGDACDTVAGSRGVTLVPREQRATSRPVVPVSPLLLSGLALAGANHRDHAGADEEDGVLTAEEIAALDLSGVEWAVLSGCDTGVGSIRAGEGVFGLRRAVQMAGARTLIMSLWPVDDEATREWMTALYVHRLEGALDTATAVREAGRDLLASRRRAKVDTHPYFWAAFVAAGAWH